MLKVAMDKGIYKQGWVVLVGVDVIPAECPTDFDLAVSSACMIKGHFPNTCFREILKTLKVGGRMAFTIRDIYLDHATDNGMNFKDALEELVERGEIKLEVHERYIKYKGLNFGSGHKEEGANILIYQKLK